MKNVILPAKVLAAAQLCQAKNDVRYYLNGIYIDSKRIAATNGHYLFFNDYSDFISGVHPVTVKAEKITEPMIISIDSTVPKAAHTAHLSIIEDMGIIEYRKAGGALLKKAFFDVIDGKYPDIDKVIPYGEPVPLEKITLNQNYLALSGKVFSVFNRYAHATFNFYGEGVGVFCTQKHPEYGNLSMIIMPAKE